MFDFGGKSPVHYTFDYSEPAFAQLIRAAVNARRSLWIQGYGRSLNTIAAVINTPFRKRIESERATIALELPSGEANLMKQGSHVRFFEIEHKDGPMRIMLIDEMDPTICMFGHGPELPDKLGVLFVPFMRTEVAN